MQTGWRSDYEYCNLNVRKREVLNKVLIIDGHF